MLIKLPAGVMNRNQEENVCMCRRFSFLTTSRLDEFQTAPAFLLSSSSTSVSVLAVSSTPGPAPGKIVSRCFVVFNVCCTFGSTRGIKSVMSLSSGRSTDTARCNHHKDDLNESSFGGVSPTIADSLWTSVKTTACETKDGPLRGTIKSGFVRDSNSRNFNGSCVWSTPR